MPHLARIRKKYGRGLTQRRKQEIIRYGKNQVKDTLSNLTCKKTKFRVGIVGAGFAGLYSGWLLTQLGLEVVVYEAMDRVGGRVHSLYDFAEGRVAEAGAELIGLNHAIMLELCRIFNLSLVDITSEDQETALDLDTPIVLDGKLLTRLESEAVEEELDGLLTRISDAAKIITYPDQPWLESPEIQALDNISVGQILDKWGVRGNVRKLFDLEISNDNVASPYRQSWLGFLCQVRGGSLCCEPKEFWDVEELFRCANGNQSVAENLAKGIPNLYLNSPVKKIYYGHRDKKFTLYTKKNSEVFDYVILATPPSMWKRIQFSPKINLKPFQPKLGPSVKYLSEVDTAFWLPLGWSPDGISNLIGHTWNSTANQALPPRETVVFTSFAGGKNAQEAIDIQKQKGDKSAAKHFRKGIDFTYDGAFSKSLIKQTLSFHSTIPYIETGYSYMGVGKVVTTGKLDNQPFAPYDGRMFFAGEYTSMVYYGFMEGALQSGMNVTKMLVDTINKS